MQETYMQGTVPYHRDPSGLYFAEGTPEPVKHTIARLRGKDTRVRLFLGDRDTGKTWSEEHDTAGYISASMGPCKVPLLIHNARSMGGGAILANCILGILSRSGWLYKAPNFDNGQWTAAPMDETHNGKRHLGAVYRDGDLYGRCSTLASAERLRAFMAGERMGK